MSKPATDARLELAANGYNEVIHRGDASLVARKPGTKQCCVVSQVGGGWHHGAGLETDTAWEADSDINYLKMVKAGYNLRARKLFNGGDLIQWTDPVSGQYVKFQPVNFQWIDGTTGSNSLISVAQAISAPVVDDDKIYWANAFGPNIGFRYTAAPTKLIKHLIIPSASDIPACPAYITNPWLELTFTLTPSSGVTMYVDGLAWNQATAKTTANAIEFRLESGEVVWSMAAPLAYDSSAMGEPCNGQIKLYVNKKVKYASVRFPKSWIDSAVFPIVLDPAVEYQVGASAADGYWYGTTFSVNSYLIFGTVSGVASNVFSRWTSVTIPDGATVDVAYMSMYYNMFTGTPPECDLYFENAPSPDAITSASDGNSRTKTTASIKITAPTSGTWWNSDSIVGIIEELMANSYAGEAAMQAIIIGVDSLGDTNYGRQRGWDYSGHVSGPKLHIEYTEAAAGGNPYYAYAQMM